MISGQNPPGQNPTLKYAPLQINNKGFVHYFKCIKEGNFVRPSKPCSNYLFALLQDII